jgi:hypothetical protein
MKVILAALALVLFQYTSVKGQDLIVTNRGDSVNCKITKIEHDYIYFTYKYQNEVRNSLFARDQIKRYQQDYYEVAEVLPEEVKTFQKKFQKIRIGAFGGFSYLTAQVTDVPTGFEKYYNDLKTGHHFGGDLGYFLGKHIGFGFNYSIFKTENEIKNVSFTFANGTTKTGTLRDDITIQTFGPVFWSRLNFFHQTGGLLPHASIGYVSYKNNALIADKAELSAGTIGITLGAIADFAIDDKIALTLNLQYSTAFLTQNKITDATGTHIQKFEDGAVEDISHIDIGIGVRWVK